MDNPNKYIEQFLGYYYTFDHEPGYAVLLKGKWGTGKTWFVKKTLEKFASGEGKYLYVSLYGVGSIEEVEDEFFKQLHPKLSSKSMALAGKIAKGLLKATLKVDLDDDGKADGSVSAQVPDIQLPEYLTNTSGFVLVFDDLERASIELESILGYINHFVEHQGHKVVIIANEAEIISRQADREETELTYRRIKEKLVGKTFEVSPDLLGALGNFVSEIESKNIHKLYTTSLNTIAEYYELSKYRNLRHLKQALWDFERFSKFLSDDAIKKNDLLEHLLKIFLVLSFETKSGNILPEEISRLRSGYYSGAFKKEQNKEDNPYQKISTKYKNIRIYDLLLEESIWVDIFDKGIISKERIQESLDKSEYFRSDNTPDWVRLWHSFDLEDEEFERYLQSVTTDFWNMEFEEIGIIKHISGILIWLSDIKLYDKTKKEIVDFTKSYIDSMKDKQLLPVQSGAQRRFREHDAWGGLGFHSKETEDFKEICGYIDKKEEESTVESYPKIGNDLLKYISEDPQLFYRRVCLSNHEDNLYYEIPIFHYIKPEEFVSAFVSVPTDSKNTVCYAIGERYKFSQFNKSLKIEMEWLEAVVKLLEEQAQLRSGKISGYQLNSMITTYFLEAIKLLKQEEANN